MSISDAIYNNMLEEKKQAVYGSISCLFGVDRGY